MREIKFEVLPDPSIFTPIQLQPRFMMSLAFNAWSRWAKENFVPFTSMIRDYRFGLVVVGGHVEYLERLSYLDADAGEVRARVRARLGGAFVQVEFSGIAEGKRSTVMPMDGCSACKLAKKPVNAGLVVNTTSVPVVMASRAA